MSRKNSCKPSHGPKLKYRPSSCIQHNQNINRQRLIPLTKELMANNISSYSLGDKDIFEPFSNLIKNEVTNHFSELKGNLPSKSDLSLIQEIVANFTCQKPILPVTNNDGSEISIIDGEYSQPLTEYELLEDNELINEQINLVSTNNNIGDTRILDSTQFFSKELMCSSSTKDDLLANIKKNIMPSNDINASQFTIKKMKELDVRLKCVEGKMDQILKTLKEIDLTNHYNIESLRAEQTMKINAINQEINNIQLDLNTCLNGDQGFESKLQDIEEKVKQSLYETEQNINLSVANGDWERTKYDDMFYELRQLKMNELYYKKSKRSLHLNQRPQINQFGPPPPSIISDDRRELRAPRFVETQ